MNVYQRTEGGHYWYRFTFEGREKRGSTGTLNRQKAERIAARAREKLIDRRDLGAVVEMTWGEAIKRYITDEIMPGAGKNLDSSLRTTTSRLDCLLEHFGADTPLAKVDEVAISDFKTEVLARGNKNGTYDRYLGDILAIMRLARDSWKALIRVPTVQKVRQDDRRERYLSPIEQERLLSICTGDLRDLVLFLLDTGCRRADALQLQWTQVLFDRKPRALVTFLKTKIDEARSVPLTTRCREMLLRRRSATKGKQVFPWDANTLAHHDGRKGRPGRVQPRSRPEEGKIFGIYHPKGKPNAPYYAHIRIDGEKLHLGTFESLEKAVAARLAAEKQHYGDDEQTGLVSQWAHAYAAMKTDEHFTVHDLRHTFASNMILKGVPLFHVGKLLGHHDPKTTKRYAHLAAEGLDSAMDMLDPILN